MYGIAIGIENTQQIRWQIDAGSEHVCGGNDDVLGEGTVAVDTHALRIRAKMQAPCQAVPAAPAHNMALTRDDVPYLQTRHVGTQLDDLTRIFMSRSHGCLNRFLSPIVPVINVYIGTADRRFMHFDQHIVTTH